MDGRERDQLGLAKLLEVRAVPNESGEGRQLPLCRPASLLLPEREVVIESLLVRIHFIIEMIWWTGLAPWEFESPVPNNLISTFLPPLVSHHSRTTLASSEMFLRQSSPRCVQGYHAHKKPPPP